MDNPFFEDDQNKEERKEEQDEVSPPPEYLGSVLRAEMLPASEVTPDHPDVKTRLGWLSPKRIVSLLVVLALIILILILFFGPGKPYLENFLTSIGDREPTSVVVVEEIAQTPTEIVLSSTPTKTTKPMSTATSNPPTPTSENESRPEMTQTPEPSSTPTSEETPTIEPSPTFSTGCVDALSVTLEDVGKVLCVRGVIFKSEVKNNIFYLYFADPRGVFYLVSYDLIWDKGEPKDCIEVTGEILQLIDTPIMIFDYNNLPQFCP
jgi:hypothetical protein